MKKQELDTTQAAVLLVTKEAYLREHDLIKEGMVIAKYHVPMRGDSGPTTITVDLVGKTFINGYKEMSLVNANSYRFQAVGTLDGENATYFIQGKAFAETPRLNTTKALNHTDNVYLLRHDSSLANLLREQRDLEDQRRTTVSEDEQFHTEMKYQALDEICKGIDTDRQKAFIDVVERASPFHRQYMQVMRELSGV